MVDERAGLAVLAAGGRGNPASFAGLYGMFVSAQVLDAHSTLRALELGCAESNPLLARTLTTRYPKMAFLGAKALLATATIACIEASRTADERVAAGVMVAINTVYAATVMSNYQKVTSASCRPSSPPRRTSPSRA